MKVPECFVCPITNSVMEDPVVTVDGFSYERRAIESWLQSSQLSPLTGQRLASTVVISNVNLHKAIQLYRKSEFSAANDRASDVVSVFPPARAHSSDPSPDLPYAYLEDSPDAISEHLKGAAVSINGRVVTRVTEPVTTWYSTAVFVARPVKVLGVGNSVVLEIVDTVTEWGGLVIGVSTVDFRQQESQTRVIDEYSYYLDAQGWLHSPDSSTTLTDWHAGTLKPGAVLTLTLPDDGRFVLAVDGRVRVDLRPDMPVPKGPLFPFFACYGTCKAVRLLEP